MQGPCSKDKGARLTKRKQDISPQIGNRLTKHMKTMVHTRTDTVTPQHCQNSDLRALTVIAPELV